MGWTGQTLEASVCQHNTVMTENDKSIDAARILDRKSKSFSKPSSRDTSQRKLVKYFAVAHPELKKFNDDVKMEETEDFKDNFVDWLPVLFCIELYRFCFLTQWVSAAKLWLKENKESCPYTSAAMSPSSSQSSSLLSPIFQLKFKSLFWSLF